MPGVHHISRTNTQYGNTQTQNNIDQDFLNSVFEVDGLGNRNGKVDEEDFQLVLQNNSVISFEYRQKIEGWYLTFLAKMGRGEVVGNHRNISVEIPAGNGISHVLKGSFDNTTGKQLFMTDTITQEKKGVYTVTTERIEYDTKTGKPKATTSVKYEYSRNLLESRAINGGLDNFGNTIRIFSTIPSIRKTPESQRTEAQKKLLKEFDDMIGFVIKIGNEYNIDPKLVLSIIEQEVGFDGFGLHNGISVTGRNGKGYMQLTTAPIADFLGSNGNGTYSDIKESLYGPEMTDLLMSKGFDVKNAKTNKEKKALQDRIMAYLKENKDPEFNIRLGALVLRYYMNKAGGNVQTAARNYNGSPRKEQYGRSVYGKFEAMDNQCATDSTYVRRRVNVR